MSEEITNRSAITPSLAGETRAVLLETAKLLQQIASLGGSLSGNAMEQARRCIVEADILALPSSIEAPSVQDVMWEIFEYGDRSHAFQLVKDKPECSERTEARKALLEQGDKIRTLLANRSTGVAPEIALTTPRGPSPDWTQYQPLKEGRPLQHFDLAYAWAKGCNDQAEEIFKALGGTATPSAITERKDG